MTRVRLELTQLVEHVVADLDLTVDGRQVLGEAWIPIDFSADFDNALRRRLGLVVPLPHPRGLGKHVKAWLVGPEHLQVEKINLAAGLQDRCGPPGRAAAIGGRCLPGNREVDERGLGLGVGKAEDAGVRRRGRIGVEVSLAHKIIAGDSVAGVKTRGPFRGLRRGSGRCFRHPP